MTTLVGMALLGLVMVFGVLDGIAWYTVLIELFMAFVLYILMKASVESYFEQKISNMEKYFNSKIEDTSSPDEKKFLKRKADRACKELKYKLEVEKDGMLLSVLAVVIALLFFPFATSWVLIGGIVACLAGLLVPVKGFCLSPSVPDI